MRRTLLLFPLLACQSSSAQEVASAAAPARAEPRNVAILVYEGVELLDFAGPGEVFSAAHGSGGPAFHVFTVAKEKKTIESQGFVAVTPAYSIADCPEPDVVVVPGGNTPDEDPELQAWVRRCAGSSELVMSVCTGAFLLAEAGLLDGLEATTHHGSLQALTANYPKTRVYTNRRFVDSGRVMTCAGVSAGIDGALHVVERMLGKAAAQNTARYMEYDWRPDEIAAQLAEPGRTVLEGPGARLAATVRRAGIEAALAEYRALATRPDERELIHTGYALLHGGKPADARALFEIVVALAPGSAIAYDGLAEACEVLGDVPAALRHAEATLAKLATDARLDPEHARTLENTAGSRIVRLGKGDKSRLRFGCAPCGGPCDEPRYLAAGPCPGCRMPMTARGAE